MYREKFLAIVPRERAVRAYEAVSFHPEKRADDLIAEAVNWFETVLPQIADEAEREQAFERVARAWAAVVAARARTMSPMITGPARFPVDRNRKAMDTEMRRINELLALQAKIKDRIAKANRPADEGPISSDDPDAIGKLQAKRDKLIADLDNMKRWNAQFRKGGVDAMDCADKLKATIRAAVEADERRGAKYGLPFFLANRRAEVKRIEARIEQMEKLAKVENAERILAPGVKMVIAADENRVRLIFDEKPEEAIRDRLKARGFRWAPSVGAWQRQLNEQAIYAAKNAVLGGQA